MQNAPLGLSVYVAIATALLHLLSVLTASAQEASCKARDNKLLWSEQMFI